MAVIDADLVPRWVLDPPAIAIGFANVALADDSLIAIPVSGDAQVAFLTDFGVAVPTNGDAEAAFNAELAALVAVVGDATVDITAVFESIDVNLTAGIALLSVDAFCDVVVPVDADSNIVIFDNSTVAPAVTGDAIVAIEDLGQGSSPLFPFQLPTRFTDNPLGIQDASAEIVIEGFSDDIQVGVFADAFIEFADYGGVFPYTLPISFEGLQGNTPIFDFVLPIVFSATANVALAIGTLIFEGDADTVVTVLADASAAITSDADRIDPTFFPFLLPAQFIS